MHTIKKLEKEHQKSLAGIGPVTVHLSCVMTPYGVPGGFVLNIISMDVHLQPASHKFLVLLSVIWGKLMFAM